MIFMYLLMNMNIGENKELYFNCKLNFKIKVYRNEIISYKKIESIFDSFFIFSLIYK